ncbi:MAG: WecB/TagA/CpsF family glycosyltransferase [Clostridia bacterium]|nr:WecB/TagA/CpsF family glycosyltransferase [Clostridia bacterium]
MKEQILGIGVCCLDYKDLENCIRQDIENGKKSFAVAINPEKILASRRDAGVKEILESADYPIPDGIGIVIASKIKKGNIKKRVTGIECMNMLCGLSHKMGYKIFLYGAAPQSVEGAKNTLEKMYPDIKISGFMDGYEQDNEKITAAINQSGADIVFVALGSPKQEYWICQNKERLCAKVFLGVGGSFDVLSGRVKRAPEFMQKIGLEWLYRLIKEPKRIVRQIKLLKFVGLLIADRKG